MSFFSSVDWALQDLPLLRLPAFEIQVFPKHKSESRSDDVNECAFDAFCAIVESQKHAFFQTKFAGYRLRRFFDDGHGSSTLCGFFWNWRIFLLRGQIPATTYCLWAGATPRTFWAAETAKRWSSIKGMSRKNTSPHAAEEKIF